MSLKTQIMYKSLRKVMMGDPVFIDRMKPTFSFDDIYAIDYDKLFHRGQNWLFFDLDQTLVPQDVMEISEKLRDLFHHLKLQGFKICILSNNNSKRVDPIAQKLGVDCFPNADKPCSYAYDTALNHFSIQKEKKKAVCIGDSLLTDIYGANSAGITSILVNPVGNVKGFANRLRRRIEMRLRERI